MRDENPYSGTLTVDIGGETVKLSLPFSALYALEQTLQESVFTLLERFASGTPFLRDVVVVLQQALAANGRSETLESVGALVLKDGIAVHLDTVTRLLDITFREAMAGKP